MADDDCKDDFRIDQDRLLDEVGKFTSQARIMSVAARGLARPLLAQQQGARELEALRAEARYGAAAEKTRMRRRKAEEAATLRADFEQAFISDLAERPTPGGKQSGLYGTVTRTGVPQPDLLVGLVTDKGTWQGYGCTDRYGAYSFTFASDGTGRLRVQEKDGAPLYQDTATLAKLAAGQSLRRDIELDAGGQVCPQPGPVDDDNGGEEPEPVTVEVPELIGRTEEEAVQLLRAGGLNRGTRTQKPSDAKEGTIIDQSPEAGTRVEPGTAVDILVARSQQQLMPQVTDIPLSLALSSLKDAGLTDIKEVEKEAPDAIGIVLAQDPRSGVPVSPETVVTLTVGRDKALVMPRLIGEKAEAAQEILLEMGVREIATEKEPVQDAVGLVVGQTPDAGSVIKDDTKVVLVIGVRSEIRDADFDPKQIPEAMAEDERMQHRGLTAEKLVTIIEVAGPLNEATLNELNAMTTAQFAERLELDNRAMATDIHRALRKVMKQE